MTAAPAARVDIIAVPFDSGHRDVRMGRGPSHLLDGGLADALRDAGASVHVQRTELPKNIFPTEIRVAFELQRAVAAYVAQARAAGGFPLVLAGNCNTAVGTIAGMMRNGASAPAVCWLDAHADFNTPETSTSGFLDGMAAAMLAGRCFGALTRQVPGFAPIADSRIVMIGVRDVDPVEEQLLSRSEVRRAHDGRSARAALDSLSPAPSEIYFHLDLDVFDPSAGRANQFAAPGGLGRAAVHDVVARVRECAPIGAAALTAYDPSFDADHRLATLAIEAAVSLSTARHAPSSR